MSAPSKFTPETQTTIIACIRGGMSRNRACATAGITRKTLNAWEKRAVEEGESSDYATFVDAMELAQDAAEGRLEAIHTALATGDALPAVLGEIDLKKVNMHALHFQLQSGGSKPWAEVKQVEVTGKDGGPIEHAEKATVRIGDVLGKMSSRLVPPVAAAAATDPAGAAPAPSPTSKP